MVCVKWEVSETIFSMINKKRAYQKKVSTMIDAAYTFEVCLEIFIARCSLSSSRPILNGKNNEVNFLI